MAVEWIPISKLWTISHSLFFFFLGNIHRSLFRLSFFLVERDIIFGCMALNLSDCSMLRLDYFGTMFPSWDASLNYLGTCCAGTTLFPLFPLQVGTRTLHIVLDGLACNFGCRNFCPSVHNNSCFNRFQK